MTLPVDPVENLARLIRCASVTPEDAGALETLGAMREAIGEGRFAAFAADFRRDYSAS